MTMQFCIHCGSKIPADSKFCPHCGMDQHQQLEVPEPSESQFHENIIKNFKRIRIVLFIVCIAVFIIFFFWGSQTPISLEDANALIDELRAAVGPEPSFFTIMVNNFTISLVLFVPVMGFFFLAFVSYNSGVVLAAIAQITGYSVVDMLVSSLLGPWGWFEIIAYGLAASQGAMLVLALFTRRLRVELKSLLLVGVLCIVLISAGAMIEIFVIG